MDYNVLCACGFVFAAMYVCAYNGRTLARAKQCRDCNYYEIYPCVCVCKTVCMCFLCFAFSELRAFKASSPSFKCIVATKKERKKTYT